MTIPERHRATCHFCKQELNVQESGVHQFVKGWAKNRTGGGAHGISLPEREWKWAHGQCVERQSSGTYNQRTFFEPSAPPQPEPYEPKPTNASVDELGRLFHVCNVCGGEAPYGIGVALRKGDLGLWYCKAHLPVEETSDDHRTTRPGDLDTAPEELPPSF